MLLGLEKPSKRAGLSGRTLGRSVRRLSNLNFWPDVWSSAVDVCFCPGGEIDRSAATAASRAFRSGRAACCHLHQQRVWGLSLRTLEAN